MRINKDAVKQAKALIEDDNYVLESDWDAAKPAANVEDDYLMKHSWHEFGLWFLGVDTDISQGTKPRHRFPYGDFRKVHRSALLASKQEAAQGEHSEIEEAIDELLALLEQKS